MTLLRQERRLTDRNGISLLAKLKSRLAVARLNRENRVTKTFFQWIRKKLFKDVQEVQIAAQIRELENRLIKEQKRRDNAA